MLFLLYLYHGFKTVFISTPSTYEDKFILFARKFYIFSFMSTT